MCLAIPGKVIKVMGSEALVDVLGVEVEVNVSLIDHLKVNEYVLIHTGFAIEKVSNDYFTSLMEIYQEMSVLNE